jgi:hypothetical protein
MNARTAIGEILGLFYTLQVLELLVVLPTLHAQCWQPRQVLFVLWIHVHKTSLDANIAVRVWHQLWRSHTIALYSRLLAALPSSG